MLPLQLYKPSLFTVSTLSACTEQEETYCKWWYTLIINNLRVTKGLTHYVASYLICDMNIYNPLLES